MSRKRRTSGSGPRRLDGIEGRWSLTLRVDAPAASASPQHPLSPRSGALRREVYAALQIEPHSEAWVTVDPLASRGRCSLDGLASRHASGDLVIGSAILTERCDVEEARLAPWLTLHSASVDDFNLWDDYPVQRRSWNRAHVLNHTFVSSAFATAVRTWGLRGLTFLQCERGRRASGEPWFVALPDCSLGRGIDHPWFDRSGWLADVAHRPECRSSSTGEGQSAFHQRWIRDTSRGECPLDAILPLCPRPNDALGGLKVVTVPRLFEGAVPPSDFAYMPWGEDGPNAEGKVLRFRRLAVSHRAATVLLEEGVVRSKALLPLRVEPEVTDGRLILDRMHDQIPPMYTVDELLVLRARESTMKGGLAI